MTSVEKYGYLAGYLQKQAAGEQPQQSLEQDLGQNEPRADAERLKQLKDMSLRAEQKKLHVDAALGVEEAKQKSKMLEAKAAKEQQKVEEAMQAAEQKRQEEQMAAQQAQVQSQIQTGPGSLGIPAQRPQQPQQQQPPQPQQRRPGL